jgi:hypothetical protein
MQICHQSVKTVTGILCSGTVVPYRRNSYMVSFGDSKHKPVEPL